MVGVCHVLLAEGTLLSLGIFTDMAALISHGRWLLSFPHAVLSQVHVAQEFTVLMVGLGFVLVGLNYAATHVAAPGGAQGALGELPGFSGLAGKGWFARSGGVALGVLTALVWAYVLRYYTSQIKRHGRVLERQRGHEAAFVRDHCLQFRRAFNA